MKCLHAPHLDPGSRDLGSPSIPSPNSGSQDHRGSYPQEGKDQEDGPTAKYLLED